MDGSKNEYRYLRLRLPQSQRSRKHILPIFRAGKGWIENTMPFMISRERVTKAGRPDGRPENKVKRNGPRQKPAGRQDMSSCGIGK